MSEFKVGDEVELIHDPDEEYYNPCLQAGSRGIAVCIRPYDEEVIGIQWQDIPNDNDDSNCGHDLEGAIPYRTGWNVPMDNVKKTEIKNWRKVIEK